MYLPEVLFDAMQSARMTTLDTPREERIARLVRDYGEVSAEMLLSAFSRIERKLGGERYARACEAVAAGDLATAADLALSYYDATYAYYHKRRITSLGKANWAPFFHPSQKKIIFSSNHASPRGYDFQLYMINVDGTGLEKITSESIFNAFPMFSPDGKYIVWSSNRNNQGTRDTNVFVAEWVD